MVATLFLFIFWSSFFSLDLLDNIKMKSLQQPPIPQSDVVSRKRNISMFLFFPLEYLEEPCSEAPANNSNTSNYRDWVKTQVRQTDGVFQRVLPGHFTNNISMQRMGGLWSVTLVLKLIVKYPSMPTVIKGTFGLANVNLSFTHFLFPNMICWLCSVAKQIRRRVSLSRGNIFYFICHRNSAIVTCVYCLILYVNMVKCPFPYKINKAYILYQINQLREYLYIVLKQ